MNRPRIAVLIAMMGLAAGCYDASTADPYPGDWLIDDFEDDYGKPASPLFENWECRPEDPTHPIEACDIAADPDSTTNRVIHLRSKLWPIAEGDDFIRSEVATFASRPLDVRPYARFEFRARLDLPGQPQPRLKAQLTCTQVLSISSDSGPSEKPSVVATVLGDNTKWESFNRWNLHGTSIAKDFFPSEGGTNNVNTPECLARVDGIKITVESTKTTSTSTFDLYVDDIKFTP